MNGKRQKLELSWVGKEEQIKLEPRILVENPDKSYGDKNAKNMLIHGDNLLALKALEQDFANRIRCIFIDPPYNTGSAFEHYDDGVEHSLWLSLMRPRLELFKSLLSDKGSLWITIDDNESHYLKVLCDEVFGRSNFIGNVIWQKKSSPQANAIWFSDNHDHILVYAKDKSIWRPNRLPRTDEQNETYNKSDEFDGVDTKGKCYGRGPWTPGDFTISLTGGQRGAQYAKTGVSENIYEIITPAGIKVQPANGRCWLVRDHKYKEMLKDHRLYFGKDGQGKPMLKRFLSEVQEGVGITTIWLRSEVGDNTSAKREVMEVNSKEIFATPKPENLVKRALLIASDSNDIVLDSFLGSGTTASVAHKMGRQWIGIELGDHCYSHCIPRLKKVCKGEDVGGISKEVGWQGGGGYKFYSLAPSLLKKDKYDNWIIEEKYNANMLAAAMAKHEGYKYCPDEQIYWKQGQSTEKDFIFTTTQFVTVELLNKINEEMKNGESLLICTKSYQKDCDKKYPQITVKKIPQVILGRCEFGKDNYNLNIINLPDTNDDDE